MNRRKVSLAIALAALPLLTIGSYAQNPAGEIQGPPLTSSDVQPHTLPRTGPVPVHYLTPQRKPIDVEAAMAHAPAQAIIPTWQAPFKSDKNVNYNTYMVGAYPFAKQKKPSTDIHALLIPVQITFTWTTVMQPNVVFDPTAADSKCLGGKKAINLVTASPIIASRPTVIQGTNLGTGQFVDMFQRANFWDVTKSGALNSGYHVSLDPVTTLPTVKVLARNYTVQDTKCGKVGLIKFADWQNYIEGALIPQLKDKLTPTTFPIFIMYNIELYTSSPTEGGAAGFHDFMKNSAFGAALQTYATASYISNGRYANAADIAALTHEVAEWMDDPFANNKVPKWGNIGQYLGSKTCATLLEAADPLTEDVKTISYNGLTFHVQDLAFTSWFFRNKASQAVSLKHGYSLYGTLKKPAADCVDKK